MFEQVKNPIQRNTLLKMLAFVVEGTKSHGSVFMPKNDIEKLIKTDSTLVTIDATVTNEQGQIRVVATPHAIKMLATDAANAPNQAEVAAVTKPVPAKVQLITLTELPEKIRVGHKEEFYPFEDMKPFPEPGNAFFVPATEERPDPYKTLTSTVASANKRYKEKDGRQFIVRKTFDANKNITGANVIRVK